MTYILELDQAVQRYFATGLIDSSHLQEVLVNRMSMSRLLQKHSFCTSPEALLCYFAGHFGVNRDQLIQEKITCKQYTSCKLLMARGIQQLQMPRLCSVLKGIQIECGKHQIPNTTAMHFKEAPHCLVKNRRPLLYCNNIVSRVGIANLQKYNR